MKTKLLIISTAILFQLTFRYWFVAIHLLTSTKKSFPTTELQRQLGHKHYEPVW